MSKNLKAHLAALLANLIYGANYSISKAVMPSYIEPAGFIVLRVFVSLLLFLLFVLLFVKKEKIERKDYWLFFLCGLFGVAINQILFFEGLARATAVNAALIITTNPVLVLLAAAYFLKENITAKKIGGIALGVAGAALLILNEQKGGSEGSWEGDVLIFLNAASYAIFLVMAKPLMKKYSPGIVITWTFFFGLLLSIPFGYKQLGEVAWHTFDTNVWMAVAYICICSTFLAYLLNVYGLKQLSPAVLSFYIYLQPIFATALSLFIADEEVTVVQGVSCLLIFAGVWLVSDTTLAKEKS